MQTYNERVLRYRVVRCREETGERAAILRLKGLLPEDGITRELIWSFGDKAAADEAAVEESEFWNQYGVWIEVIDAGQETVIERPVY